MNYTKIRPILNRILIKKVQLPTKTTGGILLPDKTQGSQKIGVVQEVGEGRLNVQGVFIRPTVKPGDIVLLPEYGGVQVPKSESSDEELFIYNNEDILAIVNTKI